MPTAEANTSKLESTPEVLLRKRRNADLIRLEKQELAKKRQEDERSGKQRNKKKVRRAEAMVSRALTTERERERIKRISKLELKKAKKIAYPDLVTNLPSEKDFILKITERKKEINNKSDDEVEEVDEDESDNMLIKEKIIYEGAPTLLFVVRVRGPSSATIPNKAFKILNTLRLTHLNTGVFIKMTKSTYPLLRLISPYIVIGSPSLSSIRSLVQKRSKIIYKRPGETEEHEIILNDNNIIEEKLGDCGIICMEDIIHEISSMGESFQKDRKSVV